MKYYHNPRCSKSRQGLKFLPSNVEIVLYLEEEVSTLVYRSLLQRYDGNLLDVLRIQEAPAKGLDLNTYSIEDLADFLTQNPIVLQRPILDAGESILIGRPVENISKFLKA
jgi:arsenate reductase (glutaredoxin)